MKQKKIRIDLTDLEPIDDLDEEELALHQALQAGDFLFKDDPTTIKKYAEIFKESSRQRKAISLRVPTQDYFAIKTKASELGLPYQALINSLIHRYVNGRLKESV
jgi:predicted DNA binding CopG/RHH family protein